MYIYAYRTNADIQTIPKILILKLFYVVLTYINTEKDRL